MGKEKHNSLSSLQERISKAQGELIVAHITYYENMKKTAHTHYEGFYAMERFTQAGIITPETRLSDKEVVIGVGNPFYKEICPADDRDFGPLNGSFISFTIKNSLSHLKEKKPDEEFFSHHFLSHAFIEPSLYLKIGNKESIPFLQETLEAWRYLELSELLGVDFPVNDRILGKLRKDKLEIFYELVRLEERIPKLEKTGKNLLELASDSESLLSKPAIAVNYGNAISDAETTHNVLLEKAIKRGYDKSDICGEVEIGDEITKTNINLKKFFSQRAKQIKSNNKK